MKVGHCSRVRALYNRKQPRSHRGWSHIRHAVSHLGFGAGFAWAMQFNSSGARNVIHPVVTCCPRHALLLGHFCIHFGCQPHPGTAPTCGLLCWAGGPGKDKVVLCRIRSLVSPNVCRLLKPGPSTSQDVLLHLRQFWSEILGAEFVNFHMGLEMAGLHIGHHNVLEKALKYSGECLFSFLLFLPF